MLGSALDIFAPTRETPDAHRTLTGTRMSLPSLINVELQGYMTVPQLKDCCRQLGLSYGGNKPDLQARLRSCTDTEAVASAR